MRFDEIVRQQVSRANLKGAAGNDHTGPQQDVIIMAHASDVVEAREAGGMRSVVLEANIDLNDDVELTPAQVEIVLGKIAERIREDRDFVDYIGEMIAGVKSGARS